MSEQFFISELAKIAKQIDAIIKRDDFTNNIIPGFLKQAVRDYPLRQGKKLRPALLIWTNGLFGGNEDDALFAATAAEIFHNWTLVHDDIIDNDELRKGKPSTHIAVANFARTKLKLKTDAAENFGKNIAILTGDIQHAWAIHTLLRTPIPTNILVDIAKDFCSLAGKNLICGEALDVEISYKKWSQTDLRKLIKIAELKTARLLQFCTICGAKIALCENAYNSENKEKISNIANFAKFAGIAFQLKDDWLGIFADEKVTGKPVMSDLSENKPSTLILEAFLRANKSEKSILSSLAGKKKFNLEEIKMVRSIVSKSGAEEYCLRESEEYQKKAQNCLENFWDSKYKVLLKEWTNFLLNRSR